jgi:ribonucleoside-diphosphate reductase alpha chain
MIKVDYTKDSLLDDSSIEMLMSFYAQPGDKSPQDIYARACTAWSKFKGYTDEKLAQRLYSYVSNKWFMFASPVLSNAPNAEGKSNGLPISCFLSYVPDTVAGLIDHSSELRWLSVMGGGVGGHWSSVRSVSDVSPGPIPFIHTVDADMTAYRQGKTRKGSYAAYIAIDHPDIIEFVGIRIPTGDTNRKAFNIHNAVNITDSFMKAVVAGEKYELVDPKRGGTGEFLDARYVWQKLLETRFRTGEPYLNFIDTANAALPEPLKKLGLKIHGSNLCNEIHLPTSKDRTAVCCLSSVNLEYYDEWKDTSMINDLVTMLDNVLEYFIENCPDALSKARYSAMRERSIGLGAMGFHHYLQSKHIAFDSSKASLLNSNMFGDIKYQATQASRYLGQTRGEAPDMAGTGLRFSHLLAIAPNASSGDILSTSPSIELNKANAYTKRGRVGSFLITNPYLKQVLASIGKDTEEVWRDIITKGGSVQHLSFLDEETKEVFKTAFEVNQHAVVERAAERQPYICQGQSVNLFFPAGAEKSYVNSVHLLAWKSGLKGLYYLRTESKQRAENVSDKVERVALEDNKETIIYGKDNCPYCSAAKKLLDAKGIAYTYVDLVELGKTAAEVTGRPDVRTVPQIYLEGKYVGGFTELNELFKEQLETDSDECLACQG